MFDMKRVKNDYVPCVYKWSWSTIHLQTNSTNSCHRIQNESIPKKFSQFHNTPKKLQDRRKMLAGIWPGRGCEYCRDIEAAGGISDRQDQLDQPYYPRMIPKENLSDPKQIAVTPKMIEVYFSNLCNMACVYCDPKFSHKWYHEVKNNPKDPSLDDHRRQVTHIDNAKVDLPAVTNKFFKWLNTHYKDLHNLRILGGEPFFQPETDRMLDYIETQHNPNITITIFSNLKVSFQRFKKYIDRLSQLHQQNRIGSVHVVCSIDCWGPEAEYVRWGLNCEDWRRNFQYLVTTDVNIQLHGTMNSLSIHTMPDLIALRNRFRDQYSKPIHYDNNILRNPSVLYPGHWPKGTFTEAFDRACELLDDRDRKIMRGYQSQIEQAPDDPDIAHKLSSWLDLADKRRGTDWRSVFTWLDHSISSPTQ